MSKPVKIILFSFIALIITSLIAQAFSAYLFNMMTGMPVPIGVTTMYDLYHVSKGLVLKEKAYLISMGIGFLIPITMLILILVASFVKPKRELHGSARFATLADVRKANLLETKYEDPDILIGKFKGKYLRWGGKEFAYLAAPTRTGKGVGIVIPNCLHYRDSLVVFDPKLENFEITSGYRKQCGQEVFLFNPSTLEYRSHRWNPLAYVSRDPDFSMSGLQKIAHILLPTTGNMDGNSKFFNGMAQQLFVGLGLYLIETENITDITPSIGGLLALSLPEVGTLASWIEQEVLRDDISKECKKSLLSFSGNKSENTRSSILASMQEPLAIFNDPVISEITSGNDFDFRDLRKKRMTIYVGIQMGDLSRFERLNNLFFSQLIEENTQGLPSQNPALKYQVLLMMDEFTSLGNMNIFEKGVAYIAGFNVRVLLIFQNMAQLNAAYTDNGARSLVTNVACQIIYTPADLKDAEDFSKIIGYETYKARTTSKGGAKSGGQSVSTSDQQRAVLLPQELMEMPASECIINLRGFPKIHGEKIIYFKDPTFSNRLGFPIPEIPFTPRGIEKNENKAAHSPPKDFQSTLNAVVKALIPRGSSENYIKSIREQYKNLGGSIETFNTLIKFV